MADEQNQEQPEQGQARQQAPERERVGLLRKLETILGYWGGATALSTLAGPTEFYNFFDKIETGYKLSFFPIAAVFNGFSAIAESDFSYLSDMIPPAELLDNLKENAYYLWPLNGYVTSAANWGAMIASYFPFWGARFVIEKIRRPVEAVSRAGRRATGWFRRRR